MSKKKGFFDKAIAKQVKKSLALEKDKSAMWQKIKENMGIVQGEVDHPTRADIFPEEFDWSDDGD